MTREEAIAELIALPQFLKGCQLAFNRSFDIGVLSIGTQLESQFLEAMCDFDQQGLCFGVDGVFVAMLDFCWDGDEWNPQTAEFELSIIK